MYNQLAQQVAQYILGQPTFSPIMQNIGPRLSEKDMALLYSVFSKNKPTQSKQLGVNLELPAEMPGKVNYGAQSGPGFYSSFPTQPYFPNSFNMGGFNGGFQSGFTGQGGGYNPGGFGTGY